MIFPDAVRALFPIEKGSAEARFPRSATTWVNPV
jgi:hypothetical protein